jgi:hypothetical protein
MSTDQALHQVKAQSNVNPTDVTVIVTVTAEHSSMRCYQQATNAVEMTPNSSHHHCRSRLVLPLSYA